MTNSSETLVSFCQTAQHHNTKFFLVTAVTVLDLAEPILLMIGVTTVEINLVETCTLAGLC